jgi:hypothetical protein
VAHKIYGVALTINCANLVYFLALEKLRELGNPAVVEIYSCASARHTHTHAWGQAGCQGLLIGERERCSGVQRGLRRHARPAELCNLHRGQGMDLYWRETNTCPTEEDYLTMIDHSTQPRSLWLPLCLCLCVCLSACVCLCVSVCVRVLMWACMSSLSLCVRYARASTTVFGYQLTAHGDRPVRDGRAAAAGGQADARRENGQGHVCI